MASPDTVWRAGYQALRCAGHKNRSAGSAAIASRRAGGNSSASRLHASGAASSQHGVPAREVREGAAARAGAQRRQLERDPRGAGAGGREMDPLGIAARAVQGREAQPEMADRARRNHREVSLVDRSAVHRELGFERGECAARERAADER
jgi:hypothetical protein